MAPVAPTGGWVLSLVTNCFSAKKIQKTGSSVASLGCFGAEGHSVLTQYLWSLLLHRLPSDTELMQIAQKAAYEKKYMRERERYATPALPTCSRPNPTTLAPTTVMRGVGA